MNSNKSNHQRLIFILLLLFFLVIAGNQLQFVISDPPDGDDYLGESAFIDKKAPAMDQVHFSLALNLAPRFSFWGTVPVVIAALSAPGVFLSKFCRPPPPLAV